eukprot:scaffold207_cov267-Pinguiococcus_pyrenoidosus.AAC.26
MAAWDHHLSRAIHHLCSTVCSSKRSHWLLSSSPLHGDSSRRPCRSIPQVAASSPSESARQRRGHRHLPPKPSAADCGPPSRHAI